MFTVLSNTRNSNLYLIAALVVAAIILLTLAIIPAISAPQPVLASVTSNSETASDYFQRHPELRVPAAVVADQRDDFALRHPEWASNVQNPVVPVTNMLEASDYFQRQPELKMPAFADADPADDYFQRHPELNVAGTGTSLDESPGLRCESPVDCR